MLPIASGPSGCMPAVSFLAASRMPFASGSPPLPPFCLSVAAGALVADWKIFWIWPESVVSTCASGEGVSFAAAVDESAGAADALATGAGSGSAALTLAAVAVAAGLAPPPQPYSAGTAPAAASPQRTRSCPAIVLVMSWPLFVLGEELYGDDARALVRDHVQLVLEGEGDDGAHL